MANSRLVSDHIAGKNGVVISKRPKTSGPGYRTYEVHQRERVGESTEKIKPSDLISNQYRIDPYPALETLRENYPCYRDWLANCYWITQYDDVTSILADEANFETRSKLWYYGQTEFGRNLGAELSILEAYATGFDRFMVPIAEQIVGEFVLDGRADLATQFAARYPLELLCRVLGLTETDSGEFSKLYWRMQRGVSWDAKLSSDGTKAISEMTALLKPVFSARKKEPKDDVISAVAGFDKEAKVEDLVVTLLEGDHQTLHGAIANLLFNLLTNEGALEQARSDRRMLKLAYLETLRHSQPVMAIDRFARHEVERFGRLLPAGALIICSAAAANRDPRIFKKPDRFIIDRNDLCQREPRGMYRADGLASGISYGLGRPSIHPAIPEDRPRSLYAITRDLAVGASEILLNSVKDLELVDGQVPCLDSLSLREMRICWKLPVRFKKN
tara:strand:+ start:575 stop:1909 length:1335 start_codon:yes stop_codon:yes gene_type:complete